MICYQTITELKVQISFSAQNSWPSRKIQIEVLFNSNSLDNCDKSALEHFQFHGHFFEIICSTTLYNLKTFLHDTYSHIE